MGENYNIDLILNIVPSILDKYSDVIFIFAMTPISNRLKHAFKEVIKIYGDRVQVAGYLDNTKELPLYYSASSLVLSIPTSDSSPLSVFESMACGALVLVSKHAWYRGKFFESKHLHSTNLNSYDLLDKIEFILNSHDTYIQDNAYDRVSSRYRNDAQVKKLDFLYNKVLHHGI
jgi:spore maturation protein CgeB